jgi:ADP-glucose pyrophosphorylase
MEPYPREKVVELTNVLIDRYALKWVNEDLGIWSLKGKTLPYPLPPVLNDEGLKACIDNVNFYKKNLQAPLYVEFPGFSEGHSFIMGKENAFDFYLKVIKETDAHAVSEHDFGKNVIPQMLHNKGKVYVHNFVDENKQPKYWRDIGTRDAYHQANMDLVGAQPEFNLFDKEWPVRTYHEQYPPIRTISVQGDGAVNSGAIVDSLISGGCVIQGARVIRSVLSSNIFIDKNALISDSVLMESVTVGAHAKIKNAIIDKEVIIPPHAEIGYDLELDRKRFAVTTSGIVIVPKKASVKG